MTLLEQNIGLVHKVAHKVHTRLVAAGSNMEYNDVFQSSAEIFLRCEKKWDESKGRLSTYYMRAAYNGLNLVVDKELKKCHGHFSEYAEEGESLQASDMKETVAAVEEASSIYSSSLNPETLVHRESAMEAMLVKLSPIAQFMLTNLADPCDEIVALGEQMAARNKWANELGLKTHTGQSVNLNLISHALISTGVPRRIVASARKELRNAAID